ncbi:mediator of RNA polymerase II transcription subunit 8-like isoform X2 [Amphibalanus amphitrite]|uniref:mediator of RNA polymerase II transcription subunit 8-like isoform X2 n=1 Tax=Amphibalanus amphitrite TaxID=1232801 RepID=UPI001C927703|nr:mediator of RNA polymerase II transcription subunit 8-like isoform X2 [Amphibalanus amphitrite]
MSMQREEKALDAALDAFSQRLNDLKQSIGQTLQKLEAGHEHMSWPSLLDSFALLSGQLNNLLRVLKNEKTPLLRNRVTLPLLLSPERDEQLVRLTEGRVPAFAHDLVPHYLRTKHDPMVEERLQMVESKAASISADAAQKQVTAMNKVVNNLLDTIQQSREDWESESARAQLSQTSSVADTQLLIAAIGTGKGLKSGPSARQAPAPMPAPAPVQMPQVNKAPSSIKTNIKANIQTHPYK